jgi:hypothetical protein
MEHKQTTLVAASLVLAVLPNVAGCFSIAASTQVEDSIAVIRGHYAQINRNASKFKMFEKDLWDLSAGGGHMVAYFGHMIAYFDGPRLSKIVVRLHGGLGRASEEYYYWDNKLIFVLSTQAWYNEPLSGEVVRTTTDRYYFRSDKLVRWIDESGKAIVSGRSEYQEKQKEYLDRSKRFTEDAHALYH